MCRAEIVRGEQKNQGKEVQERTAVQTRDELSFGKEEEEKNQINEGQCLAGTTEKKEGETETKEPILHDRQKNRFRLPEEPPAEIHVPWKPSYIQEGLRSEEEKKADCEEAELPRGSPNDRPQVSPHGTSN